MKIAINTLGPSRVKAGIGNYVFHIVKELSKADTENTYFIFCNKDNADWFNKLPENFVIKKLGNYSRNRILRILWEQLILPLQLRLLKVDILHSPGFINPLIKACKYITTVHDMTFFLFPEMHTLFKRIYFPLMMRLTLPKADIILADSNSTKEDIIKILNLPEEKIVVNYLAADDIFKPVNKKQATEFIEKNYSVTKPFILFVGMLEPRKNIPALIKAYEHFKETHDLIIVGKKGWKFEKIFEEVEKRNMKNNVHLTGFVPDEHLVYFYNAAEVFVYPSFYEGFGIPVLEAMKCKCPVITSNTSSMKEITEKVLINPHNEYELKEALNKVLFDVNLRKQLSEYSLRRSYFFSWKKHTEIFMNAIV